MGEWPPGRGACRPPPTEEATYRKVDVGREMVGMICKTPEVPVIPGARQCRGCGLGASDPRERARLC